MTAYWKPFLVYVTLQHSSTCSLVVCLIRCCNLRTHIMIPFLSSYDETHFSCVTTPSQLGAVSVYTDGTQPLTNFTYKANPNITGIDRAEVFIR